MSKIKIIFILTGAGIAAMIYGGAIEVKVRPEKVFDLPGKAASIFQDRTALEKGRAYAVRLKRRGEMFVFREEDKRLQVALENVSNDADRLRELLSSSGDKPEALLPQAELLIDSLQRVRQLAEEAPVKTVASLKEKSEQSFGAARQALGQLQELHQEYESVQKEFVRLTQSLEEQIGEFDFDGGQREGEPEREEGRGEVAGTEGEEREQQKEKPENTKIPLKF